MLRYGMVMTLVVVVSLGFFAGCGEDENPATTEKFGEVSGTVTLVGTWPSIGDVQVSIWVSWPPAGPPAAATDPLTPGEARQTYTIEGLSKGTYSAVTVGWRDPTNPAGAKVLGLYWERSDSVGVSASGPPAQPIPIEISDAKLVWSNIDIKANLDIVP